MDEKLKLFLEELNIQARRLGGLLQNYDANLGFYYLIGCDSNGTADRFSESDITSYILNETNYGTKMIDMKTLVSKFIEKDVEAEYWFIDAIDEFEIVKDMNPTGSENKDCVSRKVMNGDYSLYFYFLAVKTGEKYIVTEKMLRKMRVSKEEFLDKYGSKAKWNPQSRMRITRAGDCCYSIVPMESFLSNMRISSRTLNRLSKRLGNEPFFILYDASLNAVALEARYVVDYIRDFPITVRELGFRAMVTSTMWITENFGICAEAFYYDPRTRTLSTISDEKISASIEREEVTYDQSKILE